MFRMSPVENIEDEDLVGLYPVNINAVVRNVQKYGRGNGNTSRNIRSKRLNDLPKMPGFNTEPLYVPKLREFGKLPNRALSAPFARKPHPAMGPGPVFGSAFGKPFVHPFGPDFAPAFGAAFGRPFGMKSKRNVTNTRATNTQPTKHRKIGGSTRKTRKSKHIRKI